MASTGVYAKGIARREVILDAALRVFARSGSAGTTMRAIAEESGLKLGGVQHYFSSRDVLLTEVLVRLDDRFEELYRDSGDMVSPGDLLARAMEVNEREPERVWLYVTLLAATRDPDHPAVDFFRSRSARFVTVVRQHVRARQAAGDIGPQVDPELTARALMAAADGIQNQWLHDRDIDMAAHVRATWSVLTARSEPRG